MLRLRHLLRCSVSSFPLLLRHPLRYSKLEHAPHLQFQLGFWLRTLPSFHRYLVRYSLGWPQAELRRLVRHSLVVKLLGLLQAELRRLVRRSLVVELPALHPVVEALAVLRCQMRHSLGRLPKWKRSDCLQPSCLWILSDLAELARTKRIGSFSASTRWMGSIRLTKSSPITRGTRTC